MRVMPTRIHGILDYLVGIILILAPWVLDFANGGAQQWVPVIIGVLTIAQSLMTDYEFGIVQAIPMPMHLMVDLGAGVILAASPWVFGFADDIWWPHVVFGLLSVVVSLATETRPRYKGSERRTIA